MLDKIAESFPRYELFDPLVPVYCVTPHTGRTIHRFFDTSPFSPSGRYLALFRLPQETRLPEPGETGEVILIDLHTGEERVVAETRGWETQMGANVQWGANDTTLLFNDVDTETWKPFCVVLDPFSGEKRHLQGGIYRVSPEGGKVACANLTTMRRTQSGYGVVIPDDRVPRNIGLSDEDGLFVSDIATGECRLLLSLRECVQRAIPRSEFNDFENYEVYGFHCKWNPQGTRLIFTVRGYPSDRVNRFNVMKTGPALKYDVYTLDNDAREVHLAVPAREWDKGGHHLTWFPDGENLSMNLAIDGDERMRFVQVRYDGSGLSKMLAETVGSGHPTVHPNGRHILTDEYAHLLLAQGEFGDSTIPIRLVDRTTGEEKRVIRIQTYAPPQAYCGALRVDPHPAWDPTFEWIAFNAFVDGTRRVFVADMRELVC